MTRIGKLLSKTAIQRNLKNQFRKLQEGNGNVKVSTKLSADELAVLLKENEIDTTPHEVRELFGVGSEGITYSQLCRKSFNCGYCDLQMLSLTENLPFDTSFVGLIISTS